MIKAGEEAQAREIAKKAFPALLQFSKTQDLLAYLARREGGGGTPARPLEEQEIMDLVKTIVGRIPDLIHPKKGRLQQRSGLHILRFDGGGSLNESAGAGIVIYEVKEHGPIRRDTEIYKNSIYLDEIDTNETAAFVACIAGLSAAKAMGIEHLCVEGNCKFVVDLMHDEVRAKAPHMSALCRKAKKLANGFRSCRISHVRSEFNKLADGLADKARKKGKNIVWEKEQ